MLCIIYGITWKEGTAYPLSKLPQHVQRYHILTHRPFVAALKVCQQSAIHLDLHSPAKNKKGNLTLIVQFDGKENASYYIWHHLERRQSLSFVQTFSTCSMLPYFFSKPDFQLPNSVEHLSGYLKNKKKKKILPVSFSKNNLKLYAGTEINLNESKYILSTSDAAPKCNKSDSTTLLYIKRH